MLHNPGATKLYFLREGYSGCSVGTGAARNLQLPAADHDRSTRIGYGSERWRLSGASRQQRQQHTTELQTKKPPSRAACVQHNSSGSGITEKQPLVSTP